MLKNKKIVLPVHLVEKAVNFEDRKKLATLFALLVQVDKRVKAERSRSKKRQKLKLKEKEVGPPIRGPFYLNSIFPNKL